MPSWAEYKEIAKNRGSLTFELYRVDTTPVVAPEEMQKHLPEHLEYQKKLEAEGKLFMAGPVSDENGSMMTGSGMILYRANSIEEATRLAEQDPMHLSGARNFTVRAWLVNEGSLGLNVRFAAQKVSIS